MSRLSGVARWRRGLTYLAALSLLVFPALAQSADRWVADEAEARAVLPPPRDNERVSGAELSCAAQRWTLTLELPEAPALAGGDAEIRVDGDAFATRAVAVANGLALAVPREALEPIKKGLRLEIVLSGEPEGAVGEMSFSLRGSMIAVTAMEERCTLRDMSAYQAVTFTPYSSYASLARELRQADIDAFALATASQPALDVAMAEFGEGRRVLFARLCGSSWYYGLSGCNIAGFAPEPASAAADDEEEGPPWRIVYDTENVHLHVDRGALRHGWPDLVTLPVRGGGAALVWRWDGSAYALEGELPEEAEDEPLPLRLGQD